MFEIWKPLNDEKENKSVIKNIDLKLQYNKLLERHNKAVIYLEDESINLVERKVYTSLL